MTFSTNQGTFKHHLCARFYSEVLYEYVISQCKDLKNVLAVSTLVRQIKIVLRYCYNITAESLATVTKQKMSKAIGKVVRSN